jgi:hypothetical protein
MLKGRRNAYRSVVRKPLGKQSLINPRKVELTIGGEEERWIQLAQEDVHFRSLAYSFNISTFMFVCVCIIPIGI